MKCLYVDIFWVEFVGSLFCSLCHFLLARWESREGMGESKNLESVRGGAGGKGKGLSFPSRPSPH